MAAGTLLAEEPRWVHRRVHKIELIDARRARWTMNIDMVIPQLPELSPDLPLVVPLTVLPRNELLDLHVEGADGRSLPVLTRAQNSLIAAEVLLLRAEEVLDDVDPGIETILRAIAGSHIEYGDAVSPELARERTDIAFACFMRALSSNDASAFDDQLRSLWRDGAMRRLIHLLSDSYMLLVEIERPFISYVSALTDAALDGDTDVANAADPIRDFATIVYDRELLIENDKIWKPLSPRAYFSMPSFRGTQSHHVHFRAPSGLLVDEFVIEQAVLRLEEAPDMFTWHTGCRFSTRDDGEADPHIYLNSTALEPLDAVNGDIGEVMAVAAWCIPRAGVLMPALLGSALTTLTLVSGLGLRALGFHPDHDAAVVLVAAPVTFTPFLANTESLVVRRILLTLRFCLYANALTGFAAAALLVVPVPTWTTVSGWALAAGVSLLCSLALGQTVLKALKTARAKAIGG